MSPTSHRRTLYALFTLSGLTGLVYESIWSHYLKLFLGHAAYAQTLVIAIFMGGMAAGAWLAARHGGRWRNLLLAYAVAEGVIGLFGLGFHTGFVALVDFAHETAIPALPSGGATQVFKWGAAAALILPQSILLGMTFPLMSGALVRRFPDLSGGSIATLYFTNSFGAAIGVLLSGFVLIEWAGLPGTILTAALGNIGLALTVWLLARDEGWSTPPAAAPAAAPRAGAPVLPLLAIAALTGVASFVYEIGWLRMLSLVLGASTHGFELMLSAFILGLALGSLWIRKRIQGLADPMRFLGLVQVVMGLLALSTLVLYAWMFDLMALILGALARTDAGYAAFNVASHGLAMAVMLPTTFCAGMTLPLVTHRLIALGRGERSIGQVYAANTAGAIVGVFAAVHLGLPGLGLKGTIAAGAAIDLGLGLYILARLAERYPAPRLAATAAVAVAAVAAVGIGVRLDPLRMAGGVYRSGEASFPSLVDVGYHRDGKTATVHLVRFPFGLQVISTNGKPDASIMMPDGLPATPDEGTMVLAAAIPLAANPTAETAAIIGFGSGLTTHSLLLWDGLSSVETVEIEPAMVEAAAAFGPRVARAYRDPRSRIAYEDAKTWFSTRQTRYDIIVSEPSNPWVSGTASLFTREFYRFVSRHLTEDGVFAQWLQLYESDMTLVASVIGALSEAFPAYTLYALNDRDLLILAGRRPTWRLDLAPLFASPGMREALARVSVAGPQDILATRIGAKPVLDPLFRSYAMPPNSDYFPILDLNAVRYRFLEQDAGEMVTLGFGPVPVADMLAPEPVPDGETRLAANPYASRVRAVRAATGLRDYFVSGDFGPAGEAVPNEVRARAVLATRLWERCDAAEEDLWLAVLLEIAGRTVSHLRPAELDRIWDRMEAGGCRAGWSDRQSTWAALVRALSRRDGAAMARLAGRLLASGGAGGDPDRVELLLTATMLGHLADGLPANARAAWDTHRHGLPDPADPSVELRLLTALSAGG